jgi:hypothetical protein
VRTLRYGTVPSGWVEDHAAEALEMGRIYCIDLNCFRLARVGASTKGETFNLVDVFRASEKSRCVRQATAAQALPEYGRIALTAASLVLPTARLLEGEVADILGAMLGG